MRLTYALAATASLALASSAALADTTAYNATPAATYYFGSTTDYSPANSAVLTSTSGADQVFARFHERVTGPNGYSNFAPASFGNTYVFALGTAGISFDFGTTSGAGLAGVDGSINVLNVLTGQSVTFDPFVFTDNVVRGNTTENSENFGFAFLSGVGYNPNVNDTYRLTYNVTGLASGPKSLVINAQVGAGFVPEPASWAMMVMGFGMIGGALRSRRTAVRFA